MRHESRAARIERVQRGLLTERPLPGRTPGTMISRAAARAAKRTYEPRYAATITAEVLKIGPEWTAALLAADIAIVDDSNAYTPRGHAARALSRLLALPQLHHTYRCRDAEAYLWTDNGSVIASATPPVPTDVLKPPENNEPSTERLQPIEERYTIDQALMQGQGWLMIDTGSDVWCYGMWTDPETRSIIEYAEGDLSWTVSNGFEAYVTALDRARTFHENNGTWHGIDVDRCSAHGTTLLRMGAERFIRWSREDTRSIMERATDGEYSPSVMQGVSS